MDREKKCVNVYRTGYTEADVPGKVLQSLAVADSLLTAGPLGRSGDYIAYPQLADVGWLVEEGQTARVSNLEVREIRGPHALLYHNDGMAAAASGVKILCEPSCGGMPVLHNSFKLKKKEIESATLYATARGIYEICLNGEKVGADFLAPGLSQYNKHHYYQSYDVTKQLAKGKNEFLVSLGEGWWSGDITFGNGNRNYFGDQLAFLASLHVKYTDGSTQTVVTDPSSWRVTTDGPVVYASLFQGQVTDAQRSLANASWHPAEEMVLEGHISDETFGQTAPRTDEYDNWQLVPQEDPSPHVFTTLTAESVTEVRPGVYVYDMGQNFAGIPSITLRNLKAGQQVRFRYAEVLYPDLPEYQGNEGMLMLENIRGAMAQDLYIASREPVQCFEPHFTQHGYRYLEITGVDQAPSLEDVKGLIISSVHGFTAHYESSNPLVNRLWDNIRWSMLGNFISIPTDCPQRNERMGWSGDLSVFSRTAWRGLRRPPLGQCRHHRSLRMLPPIRRHGYLGAQLRSDGPVYGPHRGEIHRKGNRPDDPGQPRFRRIGRLAGPAERPIGQFGHLGCLLHLRPANHAGGGERTWAK